MSNYYGPRVLPDSTRGMGMLAAQLQAVLEDKRIAKEDEERANEMNRRHTAEERANELQDLTLAKQGIYGGTAPTPISEETYQQIGMAEGSNPKAGPLASRMQNYIHGNADDLGDIEIAALPGQHIGGGQFTPKAIYRVTPRIGLQDPAMRGDVAPAPRFKQLTPHYYESETETPEYKAQQRAEAQDARVKTELAARIEDVLRAAPAGTTREMAATATRNPAILDNLLFPKKEKPDNSAAVLSERVRHDKAMETVAGAREGRLREGGGKGGKGKADKDHANYRQQAADYAKGLVQQGYGVTTAKASNNGFDSGATTINRYPLVHEVSRYFPKLQPGEADGVVADAISKHAPNAKVEYKEVPFTDDAEEPTSPVLETFKQDARRRADKEADQMGLTGKERDHFLREAGRGAASAQRRLKAFMIDAKTRHLSMDEAKREAIAKGLWPADPE